MRWEWIRLDGSLAPDILGNYAPFALNSDGELEEPERILGEAITRWLKETA